MKQERKLSAQILVAVLLALGAVKFCLWAKECAEIARAHEAAQIKLATLLRMPAMADATAPVARAFYEEVEQENIPQRVFIRQQKCLAHMIDGEAGNQSVNGKKAAAYMGYARALDNKVEWGGSDICKVVCIHTPTRWQFDGAKHACLNNMQGEPSEVSMDVAYKVISGEYQPEGCLARARYFMNPDKAGDYGALWMLREAKFCTTIDGHAFFEPRPHRHNVYAKLRHRGHRKIKIASR